jgi:hypothetical protein
LVEFQSSHIIKCWITPTIVAYCGWEFRQKCWILWLLGHTF